ncbi:MAG: DUF177 domain-containing protein [Alphaproteobacteria bacterium]|nr:DUF177 domain-containing protein [Alphaproteobacteria bacterium]
MIAEPEFSRPVRVGSLPPGGRTYAIEAKPDERAALAKRFDLISLDSLKATLRLRPVGRQVRLEGDLSAEVTQRCVVTLEPIEATVEERFEMCYAEGEGDEDERFSERDIVVEYEGEDVPDPIVGGMIDIGEAVAEHLALALDPFPRKPEARFTGVEEEGDERSPFAVLKSLERKSD